jgi:hypothetical protein
VVVVMGGGWRVGGGEEISAAEVEQMERARLGQPA